MINISQFSDCEGGPKPQKRPARSIKTSKWKLLHVKGPPPPVDAEFSGTEKVLAIFSLKGLPMGRCFGSKTGYRQNNPKCIFISNANVCSLANGKLWWGDLDLQNDSARLEKVARQLRQKIYVLREGDARWKDCDVVGEEVARRAVWCTGGPMAIWGLARVLKSSGLAPKKMAALLGISLRQLSRRHPVTEALELGQRLDSLADYFSLFVERTPGVKWGQWMLKPNVALGGNTPFVLVMAGRGRELAPLLR